MAAVKKAASGRASGASARGKRSNQKTSSRKPAAGTKKTTKNSRTTKNLKKQGISTEQEIILWILLAVSILLGISNLGLGGKIGSAASGVLFGIFGWPGFIFPILLFLGSCFLISNLQNRTGFGKLTASVLLFFAICMFLELLANSGNNNYVMNPAEAYAASSLDKSGGGFIGSVFCILTVPNFGTFGAYVIDLIILIICIVVLTGKSIMQMVHSSGKKAYEYAKEDAKERLDYQRQLNEVRREERKQRRLDKVVEGVTTDIRIEKQNHRLSDEVKEIKLEDIQTPLQEAPLQKQEQSFPLQNGLDPVTARMPDLKSRDFSDIPEVTEVTMTPVYAFSPEPAEPIHEDEMLSDVEIPSDVAEYSISDDVFQTEIISASTDDLYSAADPGETIPTDLDAEYVEQDYTQKQVMSPVAETADVLESAAFEPASATSIDSAVTAPEPEYQYPSIDLLNPVKKSATGTDKKSHLETAEKLQQTLKNFGVNVTITAISCGPSVTRYEIQPEMGVKVSKIVNLSDDIKLNLAAADIRIEAPIPGKAAIGIEVPNKENVTVSFRELIESEKFQTESSKIAFAAGKDIGGQAVVTDIGRMPHLLIAGATGSGKSVCINTIIMSILFHAKPSEVKMIMIDPKVVELSVYNGIPHLLIPVVTDPKKASAALNWAVMEMTKRYNMFAEWGVRDLKGYNAAVDKWEPANEQEQRPEKMKQIVIIVDELADLMMVAPGEVEEAICRLAQLARAAGLHLIIATQRPSVNVITGLIKANMPSRIAFAVTSGVDSRTILDMNGAEKLLGKGDMLFFPQNYTKPQRVQGAFVTDQEVNKVVDFLKNQNQRPHYDPVVQKSMESDEAISISGSSLNDVDERDVLFTEVGRFLIESEKGSIGSIQRKFKVGFNRAARIMSQLEEAHAVGPEEGTKPRKILMTIDEFEQYLRDNAS